MLLTLPVHLLQAKIRQLRFAFLKSSAGKNPKDVMDRLHKQYINPSFVVFFAMDDSGAGSLKKVSFIVGSVPFSISSCPLVGASSPMKWLEKGQWHTLYSAVAWSKGQGLHSKAPTFPYAPEDVT